MGLTGSKKKFDDMFSRFDTMPECDGQTDGQNCSTSIAPLHSLMDTHARMRICVAAISRFISETVRASAIITTNK